MARRPEEWKAIAQQRLAEKRRVGGLAERFIQEEQSAAKAYWRGQRGAAEAAPPPAPAGPPVPPEELLQADWRLPGRDTVSPRVALPPSAPAGQPVAPEERLRPGWRLPGRETVSPQAAIPPPPVAALPPPPGAVVTQTDIPGRRIGTAPTPPPPVAAAAPPAVLPPPAGQTPAPLMTGPGKRLRFEPPVLQAERAKVRRQSMAEEVTNRVPTYAEVPPGQARARRPDMPPLRPGEKMRVDPATTAELWRSRLMNAAKSMGRDVPAGMLDTANIVAGKLAQVAGKVPYPGSAADLAKYGMKGAALAAGEARDALNAFAEMLFPEDKILRDDYLTQVTGGLGQTAGFMASGYVGGAAGVPRAAMPMLSGAAMGFSQGYREAEEAGAPESKRWLSAVINAGVGTSEAISVDRMLGRLGAGIAKPIRDALIEGAEEYGQEFFQQVMGNLTAKGLYDPQRGWNEQAMDAAGVGGISGVIMSAVTTALVGARARMGARRGVEPPPVVETPWAQVLEAKPETAGVGAAIEQKAAAGLPLSKEEADMVRQANQEAKLVAAERQPAAAEQAAQEAAQPAATPEPKPPKRRPAPRIPDPTPDEPNDYATLRADINMDTEGLYSDEAGNYIPERRPTHERIVGTYTGAVTPNDPDRALIIIAGGPASGKSTVRKAAGGALGVNTFVDPDDVRYALPETHDYKKAVNAGEKVNVLFGSQTHEEASAISKQAIERLFGMQAAFGYDNSGANEKKMRNMIERAKAEGYGKVIVSYVDVPIDIALERSWQRFTNPEGERRLVPPVALTTMHAEAAKTLANLLESYAGDPGVEINLFDTSGPIEDGPHPIILNGEIVDPEGWQRVLEKRTMDMGGVVDEFFGRHPEAREQLADLPEGYGGRPLSAARAEAGTYGPAPHYRLRDRSGHQPGAVRAPPAEAAGDVTAPSAPPTAPQPAPVPAPPAVAAEPEPGTAVPVGPPSATATTEAATPPVASRVAELREAIRTAEAAALQNARMDDPTLGEFYRRRADAFREELRNVEAAAARATISRLKDEYRNYMLNNEEDMATDARLRYEALERQLRKAQARVPRPKRTVAEVEPEPEPAGGGLGPGWKIESPVTGGAVTVAEGAREPEPGPVVSPGVGATGPGAEVEVTPPGQPLTLEQYAVQRGHGWPITDKRKLRGVSMAHGHYLKRLRAAAQAPAEAEPAEPEPTPVERQQTAKKATAAQEAAAELRRRNTAPADVQAPPGLTPPLLLREDLTGVQALTAAAYRMFRAGERLPATPREVEAWGRRVAGKDYGGIDDAYDAIEGALTADFRWQRAALDERGSSTVERIVAAEARESVLANRAKSLGVRDRQQYSTPLTIAEGMARAAAVRPGETIMEPSAGTGNLVEPFALRQDVNLWLNELDPRRVAVLQALGYEKAHLGDAIRIMPFAPDVVITNPPWGGLTNLRKLDTPTPAMSMPFKPGDLSHYHIVHALRGTKKGGRVVALVGENYWAPQSAPFRKWLKENFAVRAEVRSPENAYKKRGTTYGSVTLVIDKVPPGLKRLPEGATPTWAEFADIMDRLATGDLARPAAETLLDDGVKPILVTGEADAEPAGGEPPSGRGGVEPAGSADRAGGIQAGGLRHGPVRLADDAGGPGPELVAEPAPQERPAEPGRGSGGTAAVPAVSLAEVRARREHDLDEARHSPVFAPYVVRGQWAGALHPRAVVTTASLSGVTPPPLTYRPHESILEANRRGYLADENMDAIALATQNNLEGKGLLIADATGFGKARQAVGIALDWIHGGHAPRVLMVTAKRQNASDLIDTFKKSGIPLPPIVQLTDYKIGGKEGAAELARIPRNDGTVYIIDSDNFVKYAEAIREIAPTGMVADEVDRFMNEDSGRGTEWKQVHKDMMSRTAKPFFAYLSASVGTTIDDLGYLHGLREWEMDQFDNWLQMVTGGATAEAYRQASGAGLTEEDIARLTERADAGDEEAEEILAAARARKKPVQEEGWGKGRSVWESVLTPAATEQVMRELAGKGMYLFRDLWRGGMEFGVTPNTLSPAKVAEFNRRIAFMRRIENVFQKYGAKDKMSKGFGIRGALQFYYKRALFDLNLDKVIELAKKRMAEGHQVVISLINVEGTKDEEQQGHLAGAIRRINTRAYEKSEDGTWEDAGEITDAVVDKAELLEALSTEAPPLRDPLKVIEAALGKGKVAFITGKQTADTKRLANKAFQDGDIQAVVISGAGKRGINLHHKKFVDAFGAAKGRRYMVIGDVQWAAGDTVQEIGRVDRASQVSSPAIEVPYVDQSATRKFMGTIAVRMAQFGATSRGMEEAAGLTALEEFNMGDRLDARAWRNAYEKMPEDMKRAFTKKVFKDRLHTAPDVDPVDAMPASHATGASFNDFMLDLQLMPLDVANRAMEAFLAERETLMAGEDMSALGAAKASRTRGVVLETADLPQGIRFSRVKSEGQAKKKAAAESNFDAYLKAKGYKRGTQDWLALPENEKAEVEAEFTSQLYDEDAKVGKSEFGILSGDLMLNGKAAEFVRLMFSREDIERRGGYQRVTKFVSHQDSKTGQWVSGLLVPYSRIEQVLKHFGVKTTQTEVTPENIIEELGIGRKVEVRGPGGEVWTLRKRPSDGRIAIDGAKMAHRRDLLPTGLPPRAAYSEAGNLWWVPEDRIQEFLKAFPIQQAAPEAPTADESGWQSRTGHRSHVRPDRAAPNIPNWTTMKRPKDWNLSSGTLVADKKGLVWMTTRWAKSGSKTIPAIRLDTEESGRVEIASIVPARLAAKVGDRVSPPHAYDGEQVWRVVRVLKPEREGDAPVLEAVPEMMDGRQAHPLEQSPRQFASDMMIPAPRKTDWGPAPSLDDMVEEFYSDRWAFKNRKLIAPDLAYTVQGRPLADVDRELIAQGRDYMLYQYEPRWFDSKEAALRAAREYMAQAGLLAPKAAAKPAVAQGPRAVRAAEAAVEKAKKAVKQSLIAQDFAYENGVNVPAAIDKAEKEHDGAVDGLREAEAALAAAKGEAPFAERPGADSTDAAAHTRRIDYLTSKVPGMIAVGQGYAVPEVEAEVKELKARLEQIESAKAAPEAPPEYKSLLVGKVDYMLTPGGRVRFRYELVRPEDVIASHDWQTFAKHPDYPEGIQNRPYHSDRAEQMKVIGQGNAFEPRFVLSTAPEAVNGAPILAPDSNIVLGGNSRAMTIMRAIGSPEYIAYMQQLVEAFEQYGFTGEQRAYYQRLLDSRGMEPVMLVRRVVDSPTDMETYRALARTFNQPLTQALNMEAEAVSRGKALSQSTAELIGQFLAESDAETIAAIINKPAVVKALVPALIEDGVFTSADINRYTAGSEAWNEEGKRAIELAVLGSVVADPDLLASAPKSLLNKIGRAAAPLIELRGRPKWDLGVAVKDALLLAKRAALADMSVAEFLSQGGLFGANEVSPKVATLAARLVNDTPRQFAGRVAVYARESRGDIEGQMTLGLTRAPDPEESFGAHFEGSDIHLLTGAAPAAQLVAQAGSVSPELLGVSEGRFKGIRAAIDAVEALATRRPAGGWLSGTGRATEVEPVMTGAYRRFIRELGFERGKAAYTVIRHHEAAKQVVIKNLRADTQEWFYGLDRKDRARLFEVAKWLRRNHETGALEFGGLQPAGLLHMKGRKSPRAVNSRMGVDMPWADALNGGKLPNGLIIGELIPDRHAIQLWREQSPDAAKSMYEQAVMTIPRAAEVLEDFTKLQEEVRVHPLYRVRMPPRSREVLRADYGVEVRRADQVGYVPGIVKEPRTFIGKTRRLLSAMRSPHRMLKTGEAAEAGIEVKDLAKATFAVRSSFFEEELRLQTATQLLPLVLDSYSPGQPLPAGHVEFTRGVLKNPDAVVRWAKRHGKWLEDQGVDLKGFIRGTVAAGGKRYSIPSKILPDIEALVGGPAESADPKYRALAKAADQLSASVTNYILSTYLIRPSTTMRNAVTEAIKYSARTYRDFLRGMIQTLVPAAKFEELPMAQFVADIVAPVAALGKESREAFPAEALGRTIARDLGQATLPGLILRYGGFQMVDLYAKRATSEAVARGQAHLRWRAAKEAGQTTQSFDEYLKDFRQALPEDVEHHIWRMIDIFSAFDYQNVGRRLEQLKRSTLGRAILPYPTYYWKLLSGTYREVAFDPFLGAHNYSMAFGKNRTTAERVTALANMLTGATIVALFGMVIPDSWDDYPEDIKDDDLPPEYRVVGRLKLPFLKDANDHSYWVRVLDLPFIGEVVAAKALAEGKLDLHNYMNDRIGIGPLATSVLLLMGFRDAYEMHMPLPTLLGREVAGWMPASPLWMFGRRLEDPYKRRLYDRDDNWWQMFMRGFQDNFPGLSRGSALTGPTEIARERSAPHKPLRYPSQGEVGKFFVLNIRSMRESARRQALREAAQRQREQERRRSLPGWSSR